MMHLSLSSKRRAAWFLIFTITAQLFTPYYSYALTGGPSQPEVQSFEPIGTSEMVDVSSGSFTYNIPLLEVGGYPINLAYHSGSTPDDEATVCGLGWNINPGVVNRNMRGLPDDFSGDEVKKEFNLKPNRTFGGSFGPKIELFGVSKPKNGTLSLSSNMGVFYNNYNGVGFEFGISPGFSAGEKGSNTASFGLGLTANSQQGISLSPSMNFSAKQAKSEKGSDRGSLNGGLSIGNTINSRDGLTALTFGAKVGTDKNAKNAVGKAARKLTKAAKDIGLLDGTSTFSFATPSYSPSATLPFLNLSYSGAFTFGMEAIGLHFGGTARGYFSQQSLLETKTQNRAFGFLYAQNGAGNANALMDFNREKDGPFTKNTKHLPPVVFTNDIYGVTGQGIAGSYQLKRGDMGLLSDPRVQNFAGGANTGFEIGIGAPPGIHFGGDIKLSVTDSRSGRWEDDNDAGPEIDFKSQGNHVNDPNFEPAYFKIAGEKSVETDPAFFTNNGGTEALRIDIEKGGITDMNVQATKNWVAPNNSTYGINQTKRNARERRNQSIAYLTAGEAQHFGLEPSILNYPINNFTTLPQKLSRTGGTTVSDFNRPAHHLSEVSVLRQDGLRYFYGIPAYNTEQNEVSFSVDGSFSDCGTGLVRFNPGTDDSDQNSKGEENYYNKIIMPAYAHSYLLTAIVSQDYVDLTGNGPTTDDHGTYTKFNYHRVHADYAWRVPYYNEIGTSQNPNVNQPVANFNEGFKSDGQDDKANYVSGKKEYWILHSVESKTQVAEFYYDQNARTDGQSATGQKLPRLDRITLFSRPDRLVNNNTATPIKSVWFQYDQSICSGIPNGGINGKLTLKKVWFTNGISQKGKLSPYVFEYNKRLSGKDINPPYDLKAYNRWGSYQPNNGVANSTD
ncbi:MAG: hypothetical protein H7246_23700, partial [Phycisphaerae bacterium]|nr:hypothetical protein [Saprospiraceae bacterium]